MYNSAVMPVSIVHEGRFFFVQSDGVTLGHVGKLVGFQGESGWKSLLRLVFHPLWRASASAGDRFVPLEELYGRVFLSRNEAIAAILAYHGVEDAKYPPPPQPDHDLGRKL